MKTFYKIKLVRGMLFAALLVLLGIDTVKSQGTMLPLPAYSRTLNDNGVTRGYWFTAPEDLFITGLRVPNDVGTDDQSVHIVKMPGVPATFAATTTNFTTLGYWTGVTGNTIIDTLIYVEQGDVIGVLGLRGTGLTSYGGTATTYSSTMFGTTTLLTRLLYQGSISSGPANAISQEPAGANPVGRIELYYTPPKYAYNNASTIDIDPPVDFCAGAHDVFATIRNSGLNQIDSVDVNWELNGVAQPTFSYIGLLDTILGLNPTDTLLNIGTGNFVAGANTIKVFTSNPNNATDTVNDNDTLFITVNTALRPNIVTRFNPTTSSIDIDVNKIGNQVDYEYGTKGFARGTGISGNTTILPFTITGLTQGTEYSIYVRNNCGLGDTSLWAGPFNFITAFSMPFWQDFEAFTPGIFQNPWPEGWTSNGTNPLVRWESEDAPGFNENTTLTGPLYDHTNFGTSGGNYIYFEADNLNPADSANFMSPPIEIPANQSVVEINYWYFNYGSEIDKMVFSVDTNGVSQELKTYYGSQQERQSDEWIKETVYLSGYAGSSIRLKFTGYTALGYFDNADLAIDDVSVDTVPDLNASIMEIVNPSGALCPGVVNPIVALQNKGLNDLTSVDIVTNINGVIDTTAFTFSAVSTGNAVQLTLPSSTFNSGTIYDLSFYCINPNGGTDERSSDDTLSLNGMRTGLAGAITLDPTLAASSTNFISFNDLSNTVNSVGVCGAVTVTVAAGTYTDNLRFIRVPGTSPTDRLIIDGVSPDLVTLNKGSNSANATVLFEGASYITVKNMTIENTSSGTQWGAHFTANSRRDSIVNCRITMNPSGTSNEVGVGASGNISNSYEYGKNASYITVKDCDITGGYQGISFYGAATGIYNNSSNHFIGNTIDNAYYYGMYLYTQDSLLVENNKVFNFRNLYNYGIMSYYGMNFDIIGNEVQSTYYGMYIYGANSTIDPSREANIVNNMVTSLGTANGIALYVYNPLRINVYHNSIYGISTQPTTNFQGTVMDSLDVRNNIFASNGGVAFRMNGAADTTVFLKYDNNVYYGRNATSLLDVGGNLYGSLSAYQTARPGFNINSIEGDPSFISDTNLRIVGILINDAGDNGVGILDDLDGDVRPSPNATFVDPGADEYDPPACPSPISFKGEAVNFDSIMVSWRSGFPGSNVDVNWTLTGNPRGSGDLAATTSDTINIGNLVANTSYDFYIREICRRGDTSLWVGPITVVTPCEPFTARYTTNFDNMVTQLVPDCWLEYNKNNQYAYAKVSSNWSYSPSNALTFYNYPNASGRDTLMSISPRFLDLPNGNIEINFFAWTNQVLNYIIVATADRPDQHATFTNIDTIVLSAAQVWEEQFVELTTANGYNGTDEYIVFSHSMTQQYAYFAIDDFVYDTIPSCRAPRNVRASNTEANDIDLAWENPSGATSWEIQYSASPLTIGNGTVVSTSSIPTNISGLNANTDYDFVVRSICGAGDTSLWSRVSTITTACDPFTARYFENFDNMTTQLPAECWTEYNKNSLNAWVHVMNYYSNSPNNALLFYNYNNATGQDTLLTISPKFSDMPNGNTQITFQALTSNILNYLVVSTADRADKFATFTPIDTINFTGPTYEWSEQIVEINAANGYNGTDEYIVFSHSITQAYNYIGIDDFDYDTIPSCPKPRDLEAVKVSADSANLKWYNPSASTSWEIRFDIAGTPFDTVVNSHPFTMHGLNSNTYYEYAVRSICTVGDSSEWSHSFTFKTECLPFTSRYTNNFDSEPLQQAPSCWIEYNKNSQYAYAQVYDYYSNSLNNSLLFYNYNNATGQDTLLAISPQFSDLTDGDKRINFYAWTNDVLNYIVVSTADRQGSNAYFTPFDTIQLSSTQTWEEFTIDITTANGYNGTDQYIVFSHSITSNYRYFAIDDFAYETIPTCIKPSALTETVLSGDSVIVNWNEANSATEWEFVYGFKGFNPDTATVHYTTNSNKTDTMTGLAAGTFYDWYVRSICVVGDTSYWSRAGSFQTECAGVTAPYFNDFENEPLDSLPLCWTEINTNYSPYTSLFVRNYNPRSGNQHLYMYQYGNYSSTDRFAIVSPQFIDMTNGDKRVDFWLASYSDIPNLIIGTAASTSPTATFNPLDTVSPDAAGRNVTYKRITVNLTAANGYNGTDEYVVLAYDLSGSNSTWYYEMYIDDFSYEDMPSCPRPSDMVTSNLPTGDSTIVNWTENSSATDWEIRYGAPGFDLNTGGTSVFSSNKPDTLSGLSPATPYDWYIRSICAVGDTSEWTKSSFQTECVATTAPFTTSFENDDLQSLPLCWTEINTNYVPWTQLDVQNWQPRTGSNFLYMYQEGSYTSSDRFGIVSPQFSDMPNSDKRVKFWMYSYSNIPHLIVGTAASTSTTATFNALDTVNVAGGAYEEFTVELTAANGYNGTDEYVVLAYDLSGGNNTWYYELYIDDFTYEQFLTCIPPSNVTALNIDSSSATLTWDVLDTAAQWEVQYGAKGFNLGSGTTLTANSDTFLLSGLNTSTYYDVYVRAVCNPSDKSAWSRVYSFATECPTRPITLPFIENWENLNGSLIGDGIIDCDTSHSWVFDTDGPEGRLRYGTNAAAVSQGSGAVTMDIASGLVMTKNLLVLSMNLTNYSGSNDLELSFDLRDHGDEVQAGDRIWVRGSGSDAWVQVFNVATNATATYTRFTVDVDAALRNAVPVQNPSSSFQIRFGQEDDSPTPNDGVSFDSIRVSGTPQTVGLIENQEENTISVYPNPSSGLFNLNINTVNRENFNLIIRDVKGQTVYTKNVSVNGAYRDQLDLNGWAKGIYYLQIQSESGTKVEKLIIQ